MFIEHRLLLGEVVRICGICGTVYKQGENASLCESLGFQELELKLMRNEVIRLAYAEYSHDNSVRTIKRHEYVVRKFWYATPNESGTAAYQSRHGKQRLETPAHSLIIGLDGRGGLERWMSIDELMIRMRGNEEEMERLGLILPACKPQSSFWGRVSSIFARHSAQNA